MQTQPPSAFSHRRPSMVERRSSITAALASSTAGRVESRTATPEASIPFLAGLEKPLPESIPEEVDVVICGTGLTESILAAALSWQGSNVLHIDSNSYYGDSTATLSVNQLTTWVEKVNKGDMANYTDASLYIPNDVDLQSLQANKDFGIDLIPKILFAKSDLLSVLIRSRVYKYLEFLPLSSFHFYENDNFEKMHNTKADIFQNQSLSLRTKRNLMKFIKFALTWETQQELWAPYKHRPIMQFLQDNFKLETNQINELIFSIGLCTSQDITTPEALTRIKRFLVSFDVYGNFPVMHSKYGGCGEISQGFCRSAAVAGTTYKLNASIESYDAKTKIAKLSDNSMIKVNEKIVLSTTQKSPFTPPASFYEIRRLTVIVKKSCDEWFENGESSAIVVFPTGSLKTQNKYAVQAIIMGERSGTTIKGSTVWYLSTIETGEKGKLDLEAALETMGDSLLRESSLATLDSQSMMTSSSIRMGSEFPGNIKSEATLKYYLRVSYVQKTSIPHSDVVKPMQYRRSSVTVKEDQGGDIIFSSLPSSEISYDGIITTCKMLYEKIVGSDDDFFDVDFEDDEEAQQDETTVTSSTTVTSGGVGAGAGGNADKIDSAGLPQSSGNVIEGDIDMDDNDGAVEFADDMEL
ncbi:hypothetical protein WICPIJ_001092 [Wickerhamomyces pijperi]|uniref:Rab proteins geranylgeranyltransferase component A n=1 Tax=Wickerhamomyces pijperi TaxID=599730 RepID=A0A9P8TRM7_WICPI|nr:hypothetical protein WICPIJ_001092 [Wickerhamomyces pijperi]